MHHASSRQKARQLTANDIVTGRTVAAACESRLRASNVELCCFQKLLLLLLLLLLSLRRRAQWCVACHRTPRPHLHFSLPTLMTAFSGASSAAGYHGISRGRDESHHYEWVCGLQRAKSPIYDRYIRFTCLTPRHRKLLAGSGPDKYVDLVSSLIVDSLLFIMLYRR